MKLIRATSVYTDIALKSHVKLSIRFKTECHSLYWHIDLSMSTDFNQVAGTFEAMGLAGSSVIRSGFLC